MFRYLMSTRSTNLLLDCLTKKEQIANLRSSALPFSQVASCKFKINPSATIFPNLQHQTQDFSRLKQLGFANLVKTRCLTTLISSMSSRGSDKQRQLDEVGNWSPDQLADWFRLNTNLNETQIRAFKEGNFGGLSALNPNISSVDALQRSVPTANSDAWQAILKLRIELMVPVELRQTMIPDGQINNLKEMPFVGCQAALDQVWSTVQARAGKSWSEYNRLKNPLLFAAGPQGIGKTRFGIELPDLLMKKVQDAIETNEQDHFILQCLSTKRITLMVSFQNGSGICSADHKWKTSWEKANWVLTSRAIYNLFNIQESYPHWASKLAGLLGDDLPVQFQFGAFVDGLFNDLKPTALYFYMDEFQKLLGNPEFVVDVFRAFSTQYIKFNSESLLTLLLYSGTMFSGVEKLFGDNRWGHSANYPMVSLPMECLNNAEVFQLVEQMQAKKHLPWLPNDWHRCKEYLKLFACTGGVPRLLEILLDLGAKTLNLNEIANQMTSTVQERYNFKQGYLLKSCQVILSGKHYKLDSIPYPDSTVEQLIANGGLYLGSRTGNLVIPFLYFRMVYSEETTKDSLFNIAAQVHNKEIDEYITKLGAPNASLNWSDFEKVNLIHEMMKVSALLALGNRAATIKEYFKHCLACSNSLLYLELKLESLTYIELEERWPDTSLGWPKPRVHTQITVTPDNIFNFVFLNAPGSSCDGFMFVNTTDGQVLLFAHQNKHSAAGATQLTFAEVKQEVDKMKRWFETWLAGVNLPKKGSKKLKITHKKNMVSNSNIELLRAMKPKLVPVIFTNHSISEDDKIAIRGYASSTNLIVINDPAHFGPWQSMLQFFSAEEPKTNM